MSETSSNSPASGSKEAVPKSLAGSTSNIPNELFVGPDGRPLSQNAQGASKSSSKVVPQALVPEDDIRAVEGILNYGGSNDNRPVSHTHTFVELQKSHQNHLTENDRNFGTSRLDDVAPNADGVRRLRTSGSSTGLSNAPPSANVSKASSNLSLASLAKTQPERATPEVCVPLNPDTGSVPLIHPEQTDRGLPYAPDEKFHNSGSLKLPKGASLEDLSRSPSRAVLNEDGNVDECAPPEPWENEYNEVLDDVENAVVGTSPLEYTSKPLAANRQRSTADLTESDNICGLTAGKSDPITDVDESQTIDEQSIPEAEKGFYTKDGEGTAGLPFDIVSNLDIPNENAHESSRSKKKHTGPSLSSASQPSAASSSSSSEPSNLDKVNDVKKNIEVSANEPQPRPVKEDVPKSQVGGETDTTDVINNSTPKEETEESPSTELPETGKEQPSNKAEPAVPTEASSTKPSEAAEESTPRFSVRPNKFTGSRAGFVAALESRLQKGPLMRSFVPNKSKSPSGTKSPASGETSEAGVKETETTTSSESALPDARKSRARGPVRRPPTSVNTKPSFSVSGIDVFLNLPQSSVMKKEGVETRKEVEPKEEAVIPEEDVEVEVETEEQ